jgi:hypothetical protein
MVRSSVVSTCFGQELKNSDHLRSYKSGLVELLDNSPCIAPRPLPDGDGRAGTGGRDFVYADISKSARLK